MKLIRKAFVKAVLCAISFALIFAAISLWNKSDFCRGWAEHYAERAAALRNKQSIATAGNRPDAAASIARTANSMALIALKYERVASNPFLAYPTYPLVTDAELAAMKSDLRN